MDYKERQKIEEEVECILLERLKRSPHDIKLIKVYSLFKMACELKNIKDQVWDIKTLMIKR